MMYAIVLLLGMNFGWGHHDVYSNPLYWANYNEIYCEDVPGTNECVHRDEYDWIFFCDGHVCTEDDVDVMPEDCTIESIEAGACRYGILP